MWNQGTFRILFFVLSTSCVEIVLEATIYRVFPYLEVGVIIYMYILSSGHKLEGVDPTSTLDSWFGT